MNYTSRANICFNCIHAVPDDRGHGCPWSEKFEPVPGWTAEKTMISLGNRKYGETYYITECPQFEEG